MSGRYFNYNQHFINNIAGDIEDEAERNKICWPWVYSDTLIDNRSVE